MSTIWAQRKAKLRALLGNGADEEGEGLALDGILHGQAVIGRTPKTVEIDKLRFSEKDLVILGPLAAGQFGKVELVNCNIDNRVYVRKRMSKKTANKTREQCSPQLERDILVTALKSKSTCVPQILCAFQCSDFLDIVMEYAEGGSLWDVVESSPYDGRISADDLKWWIPQCVTAISWCHQNNFVHRDIKPHNFVFRPDGHVLLIDFGSAATLLPATPEGVQLVPKQHCFVPCGTCDYISPEILKAHEEALVALELGDSGEENGRGHLSGGEGEGGYGKEVDWWSLGAMIYEVAFGVAPFFANDIRQTYAKIIAHNNSLRFPHKVVVPQTLIDLLSQFLRHHDSRLGRYLNSEIMRHPYFRETSWSTLHKEPAPPGLHLPQFTYTAPLAAPIPPEDTTQSSTDSSKPFAFSAFFQSSMGSSESPILHATPARRNPNTTTPGTSRSTIASFIGFSWGPAADAFKAVSVSPSTIDITQHAMQSLMHRSVDNPSHFVTPMRPSTSSRTHGGLSTVRVSRAVSSARRLSAQHRPMSDREAMKQLVDCVEMSARKRVLESGKKPRILLPHHERMGSSTKRRMGRVARSFSAGPGPGAYVDTSGYVTTSAEKTVRKELRFVGCDDTDTFTGRIDGSSNRPSLSASGLAANSGAMAASGGFDYATASETSTDTDAPPSPSPSPRPGSAMSMISMTRRSATPTFTMTGSGSGTSFPAFPKAVQRTSSEPNLVTARLAGEKLKEKLMGEGRGEEGDVRKMVMRRSLGRVAEMQFASSTLRAVPAVQVQAPPPQRRRVSEPSFVCEEVGDEEEEEEEEEEENTPVERSSDNSSEVDVNEMTKRHDKLMRDIASLQQRLQNLNGMAGAAATSGGGSHGH